jgi:hypothetical protein
MLENTSNLFLQENQHRLLSILNFLLTTIYGEGCEPVALEKLLQKVSKGSK